MSIQLEASWKTLLEGEFEKPYMAQLKAFLQQEKAAGKTVYPPPGLIFNSFAHTPVPKVKVVIIGQDPYHGKGQAHGLSFSVQKGVGIPPSLRSIYKELQDDIPGFRAPAHGELTKWADQGVLLLNATLTVRAGEPASHQKKGWEEFTDTAIRQVSERRSGLVFLLWGKFAQSKAELIAANNHTIFTAAHPSPYSASFGFFGCKHFSKTNEVLKRNGETEIDWQVA